MIDSNDKSSNSSKAKGDDPNDAALRGDVESPYLDNINKEE